MNLMNIIKLSLLLTIIVIAMGAYTRLADAGLGCPDWPGCYGHLTVPTHKVDVQVANTLYPERVVEQSKAWLEMIHRYLAGALGLLVFMITAIALSKERAKLGVVLPLALSIIIVFQAALGMWTVTLKLMPIVVMGHLLGGFTMFSLLFVSYLRLRPRVTLRRENIQPPETAALLPGRKVFQPKVVKTPSEHGKDDRDVHDNRNDRSRDESTSNGGDKPDRYSPHVSRPDRYSIDVNSRQSPLSAATSVVPKTLKMLAGFALVVTIIQIMLGGWTSSNYAAVVCTSLPICEGQWFDSLDFVTAFTPLHLGVDSYEFGILDYAARMTIHVTHRLGAIVVAFTVGMLAFKLMQQEPAVFKQLGRGLGIVLAAQLALGISNVVFHLPLGIAVLHNLGAAILLLTLIKTNYIIRTAVMSQIEKPVFTVVESKYAMTQAKASGDKENTL
ncbi:heme A synthase [Vibrio sp. 10N.261.51.F12]|uniref:COX15/CtaA family protein n=1 Tax=Vibrio sp. 10N.261.51.F12 TaxID=3229679 RepID=UPI00355222A7